MSSADFNYIKNNFKDDLVYLDLSNCDTKPYYSIEMPENVFKDFKK
ncbi:hypothetical protein EZS27_013580 [termite gut metagenome]|uniref:Uncharacterized protein n=1 Tax=termite gut metagenome TaxID=433724 RepID=A0A5J4RWS1_9ZZZZ